MSLFRTPNRHPNEPGSRSPGSEEAQQQNYDGSRGASQASEINRKAGQPAQADNRPNSEAMTEPEERKSFPPGHAPSEQGRGSPKPDTIAQHQQGIGRQSGSHSADQETVQEQAVKGPPADEHARAGQGREHLPADRNTK